MQAGNVALLNVPFGSHIDNISQKSTYFDLIKQLGIATGFKEDINLLSKKLPVVQSAPQPSIQDHLLPAIQKPLDFSSTDPVSIKLAFNPPEVIIARPLKELWSHVKHRKMPRLELIARTIKTLFLVMFTNHLCDKCLIKNGDNIVHSLAGKGISTSTSEGLQAKYPYLLDNALTLIPRNNLHKEGEENFNAKWVSPDVVRDYFKSCYKVDITGKAQGNTISDLFKSNHLELRKSV